MPDVSTNRRSDLRCHGSAPPAHECILALPGSLDDALQAAEGIELLREVLGDHVYKSLLENQMIECDRHRPHIPNYGLKRYVPSLGRLGITPA